MFSRGLSLVRSSNLTLGASGRCFESLSRFSTSVPNRDVFKRAQTDLKKLKEEPEVDTKLQLYALFKQASSGDVTGTRPGMMDFAGRAKFDAWAAIKGLSQKEAGEKYAAIVESLLSAEGSTPSETDTSAESNIEGLPSRDGLDVSIEGKVFKITLNRPKKFNALTMDMYQGIIDALEASSKNPNTSVTVLTGAGNYFCSGNDLTNFAKAATASKAEVKAMAEMAGEVMQRYVQAYIDHDKPLIAVVNGPAVGISVTVLPLCDYVIATDKSSYHTPFASLGQSAEACSSYTFPLLMGHLKAAEVLIFGKKLSAAEAQEYGLVSKVVPDGEFLTASAKAVEEMAALPPQSLRINKTLLRNIHKENLTKQNKVETETIIGRWQSKECAAAIASFLTRSKK